MAKVAVVILNWNGSAMLSRYLPDVVKFSRDDAEVWVVDNASTDDSMQLLNERFPTVRTMRLDKNYGFAGGYNKALLNGGIQAEYFVLLNSDVAVTHHWLTPLIEYMDNDRHTAVCQPKILSEADHDMFEYAGACGGFLDKYGYPFCRGRIFSTVERDNGQYDFTCDLLWATGACLMIRSSAFIDAGGFDERFFAHQEEIDLCWRIRQKGESIKCVPESVVYHVGGGTLPQGNPQKTFLNFRNNLTMLYKNLPDRELGQVMRVRFFLDYLAALQCLLKLDIGGFRAIFRARRAFRKWRHDFDGDRLKIQKERMLKPVPERRSYSILVRYFLYGKHKFDEIDK